MVVKEVGLSKVTEFLHILALDDARCARLGAELFVVTAVRRGAFVLAELAVSGFPRDVTNTNTDTIPTELAESGYLAFHKKRPTREQSTDEVKKQRL